MSTSARNSLITLSVWEVISYAAKTSNRPVVEKFFKKIIITVDRGIPTASAVDFTFAYIALSILKLIVVELLIRTVIYTLV
jgi:hypothetical protein